MADDMINATLSRLEYLVQGLAKLNEACEQLAASAGFLAGTGMRYDTYAGEVASLTDLAHGQRTRLADITGRCAHQLGWQVAMYEIAPIARESADAIAWITGNSYMPPLRDFGNSERVWALDHDCSVDLWAAYVEGIESKLDDERVLMAAPDYDNSLYVVDLRRFEYVEDSEDADSLESEWRPIQSS